jgi:hypothetical protein
VIHPTHLFVQPHAFRPPTLKPLGAAHTNPRSPRPAAALAALPSASASASASTSASASYPSGSQTARTVAPIPPPSLVSTLKQKQQSAGPVCGGTYWVRDEPDSEHFWMHAASNQQLYRPLSIDQGMGLCEEAK